MGLYFCDCTVSSCKKGTATFVVKMERNIFGGWIQKSLRLIASLESEMMQNNIYGNWHWPSLRTHVKCVQPKKFTSRNFWPERHFTFYAHSVIFCTALFSFSRSWLFSDICCYVMELDKPGSQCRQVCEKMLRTRYWSRQCIHLHLSSLCIFLWALNHLAETLASEAFSQRLYPPVFAAVQVWLSYCFLICL